MPTAYRIMQLQEQRRRRKLDRLANRSGSTYADDTPYTLDASLKRSSSSPTASFWTCRCTALLAPNAQSYFTRRLSTPPPAPHSTDVSSTTVAVPPLTPFAQDSIAMRVDGPPLAELEMGGKRDVDVLLEGVTSDAILASALKNLAVGMGGERGEGGSGPGAPPNSAAGGDGYGLLMGQSMAIMYGRD
ncbi:hypothetical protein B0H34DRAFT_701460 [Crassisporium funariophilum]|nr:hypothetical protein B0H34DRAFT_701460 [Crassisporium funariophilum]